MDNNTTDDKSTVIQYLTYALPTMIMGFLLYPVQLLLAGMYAKHFGLLLTTIASVVFVARLFDAVTDPLIGYLSDRYCIRKGTRKPWVIIGCLGTVISGYYLFTPPDNVSVGYFLCWYMAFYLAFTVFEIPHMTWGGELAISSHQKNRIYSLRSAFLFLGLLMYAAMPLLPIFEGEGFTPQTLRWSALISAVLIIPALVICVRYTPDGRSISPGKMKKDSPRLVLKAIIENRPLLILLAGLFFIAIADGMYLGLTFIFVDSYLGHGEKLPLIFTISLVLGLMATGAMYLLSARVEKVKLYTLGSDC